MPMLKSPAMASAALVPVGQRPRMAYVGVTPSTFVSARSAMRWPLLSRTPRSCPRRLRFATSPARRSRRPPPARTGRRRSSASPPCACVAVPRNTSLPAASAAATMPPVSAHVVGTLVPKKMAASSARAMASASRGRTAPQQVEPGVVEHGLRDGHDGRDLFDVEELVLPRHRWSASAPVSPLTQ